MAKKQPKYRHDWLMSDDCRRPKEAKQKFLDWICDTYWDADHPPTPEEVIKAARAKRSPIHDLFEWDVNEAAKKAWLDEAGYYLRHLHVIKVEVRTNVQVGDPVRAFIPVTAQQYGRRGAEDYMAARRVASDPSLRATVLQRAHQDFVVWFERYKRYSEFMDQWSPVITVYEKTIKKHKTG